MARDFDEHEPVEAGEDGPGDGGGLGELARLLERPEHADGHWPQLAARIAALLNAENCWIVFADSGDDGDRAVRAYGNGGAGQVRHASVDGLDTHPMLARASAMLLPGADAASPAGLCDAGHDAIFAPIRVDGMLLGILNVHGEKSKLPFGRRELETSQVVALLIGNALHLGRLQKILRSRFAQLALLHPSAPGTITLRQALRQPEAAATVMAKAFYREMARSGFAAPEIIAAATEIISELTNSLRSRGQRGRERAGRAGPRDGPGPA